MAKEALGLYLVVIVTRTFPIGESESQNFDHFSTKSLLFISDVTDG